MERRTRIAAAISDGGSTRRASATGGISSAASSRGRLDGVGRELGGGLGDGLGFRRGGVRRVERQGCLFRRDFMSAP